jgi:hypothetical protein
MDTSNNTRLHWNYFLALEKDLEAVSRYIEFSPDNFNTYSIELAHLLLSAASEADTLAKCICGLLNPNARPSNINEYRKIIKAAEDSQPSPFSGKGAQFKKADDEVKHRLSGLMVYVPRYSLKCVPWESWAKDENPDWWHSYNKVKHERNLYFNKATLRNALQSLAALLTLNYLYCRLEISKAHPHHRYQYQGTSVTIRMGPQSTFIRFAENFYVNPVAELGRYINSVSEDVKGLQNDLSERD